MIAERSPVKKADARTQLELLVEEDVRLVPGTVRIEEVNDGQIYIFAETVRFGSVSTEVNFD